MTSHIPDEIKLKKGESTEIRLKGLATAGYQWEYSIDHGKEYLLISKRYLEPADDKAGSSADEVFKITGLKSGTAVINIFQRRNWEKNADPLNKKEITIEVE